MSKYIFHSLILSWCDTIHVVYIYIKYYKYLTLILGKDPPRTNHLTTTPFSIIFIKIIYYMLQINLVKSGDALYKMLHAHVFSLNEIRCSLQKRNAAGISKSRQERSYLRI